VHIVLVCPVPALQYRNRKTEKVLEEIGFDRTTRAWRPGYSKDGQLAIVMFSIPWSIHHADATYVLVRQDGAWKVRVRQFVIYP